MSNLGDVRHLGSDKKWMFSASLTMLITARYC